MTANESEILAAVRAVSANDPRTAMELALTDPQPVDDPEGWDSLRLDEALRQADSANLLDRRDRYVGDGSVAWWYVQPSLAGLRAIGHWPPSGGENLPGPWDRHVWGQVDRPLLQELIDAPPRHGFLLGPSGGSDVHAYRTWLGALRLLEAGLITGSGDPEGISDVLVTAAGRRAVAGVTDDPIDRAIVELQRNAKVEAMTAAVEEALGDALRGLATVNGIDVIDQRGKPLHLSALNDALRSKPVYGESWGAEIAGYLALRNETNHGRGKTVSLSRIERAIAGIREFRDNHQ